MPEEGYLSIKDVAGRAGMSEKLIRRHLEEIPHHRLAKNGKIWVKWSDFQAFMERARVEARADEDVRAVLVDLFASRKTA